jgi:hypothetical protein
VIATLSLQGFLDDRLGEVVAEGWHSDAMLLMHQLIGLNLLD